MFTVAVFDNPTARGWAGGRGAPSTRDNRTTNPLTVFAGPRVAGRAGVCDARASFSRPVWPPQAEYNNNDNDDSTVIIQVMHDTHRYTYTL